MKKFLFIIIGIFTILFLFFVFLKFNFFNIKDYIFLNLSKEKKVILRTIKKNKSAGLKTSHIFKNFINDYNTKFLPETQFLNFNFDKKKIKLSKEYNNIYFEKSKLKRNIFYSFFIELSRENILITDYLGNFYLIALNEIEDKKKKEVNAKIIPSNIKVYKVLDTLVHKENLYLSYATESEQEKNCYKFNIFYANLNDKYLNFKKFYTSMDCVKQNFYQTYGGRIKVYKHNNEKGILLTVGDDIINKPAKDRKNDRAQNDSTIIGKIIFINFSNGEHTIFSKGHRNPQGLYVENELILSTEHGPNGGDEINRILFGKNYGWPISSYGETYTWGAPLKNKTKVDFNKDHKSFNYIEPIFSFVPSIGISEIVKVPENFSIFWKDNFLIASLYGHSLYRVKFNEEYTKILFSEKIFIGDRIRDLKFNKKNNTLIMALEEESEIGILRLKK